LACGVCDGTAGKFMAALGSGALGGILGALLSGHPDSSSAAVKVASVKGKRGFMMSPGAFLALA
jgi:hypothetical protein